MLSLSIIKTNNISTNIKIVITSVFLASLTLTTSTSAEINVMTLPSQKPTVTKQQQSQVTSGFLGLRMVRADGSNSNVSTNTESGSATIVAPNLTFNSSNSTSSNSNPQQVFGFKLSTTNGSNSTFNISNGSSFGNLNFSNGNSTSNFNSSTMPTAGKGVVIYNVPVNSNTSYNFGQFVMGQCPDSFNAQMVSMINDFRRQNGVAPVQLDNSLNYVACQHSNWMKANNNLDHTGVDGTDPFQRCARARTSCNAENIAFHSNKDINWMMEFFRNSPSHRANMLNPEYTKAGIGLSDIYATQLFAN